jgi:glutaredoxin
MKIRFLYFDGCPNKDKALSILNEVIKEKGLNLEMEVIKIESYEDAIKYNFLGSPTIQINGIDIEKERRNDKPLFGCRFYKTKEGLKGYPTKEMIINAIDEIIKNNL